LIFRASRSINCIVNTRFCCSYTFERFFVVSLPCTIKRYLKHLHLHLHPLGSVMYDFISNSHVFINNSHVGFQHFVISFLISFDIIRNWLKELLNFLYVEKFIFMHNFSYFSWCHYTSCNEVKNYLNSFILHNNFFRCKNSFTSLRHRAGISQLICPSFLIRY
jgi:hypothetical protein